MMNKCNAANPKLSKIKVLPLQDAIWTIIEINAHNSETSTLQLQASRDNTTATAKKMRHMVIEEEHNGSQNMLFSTIVDRDTVSWSDQILDLICKACLNPQVKSSRKPRFLNIILGDVNTGAEFLNLDDYGIKVFFSKGRATNVELKKAQNSLAEDTPWFRSCHNCGRRGTANMFSLCPGCGGVLFCDEQCRKKDHMKWCAYFKEYMSLEEPLGCLPFNYSQTTTARDFNVFRLRQFLRKKGVHGVGLWKRECKLSLMSYYHIPFGEMEAVGHLYGTAEDTTLLQNYPIDLYQISDDCPRDWKEYYQLRGLNEDSPVAALLHYSLTLAYVIKHLLPQKYPSVSDWIQESQSVCVHVVGAAKEADLRQTFKECAYLLHPVFLHICLIGPEISDRMHLHTESTGNLRCSLFSGLYHRLCNQLPQGDIAISFNAGLGAYKEFRPTVQKILTEDIPYFCTDYCLASYRQSQESVSLGRTASLSPLLINPFRSPLRMVYTDMDIPRYSNAVIFSVMKFDDRSLQD